MDTFEAIATKLDVKEFAPNEKVPGEVKRKILEAARLTGSSRNLQHWRFILIQDRANLKRLADDSTSGKWVEGADFAVVILTDPSVNGHAIDAGRALQDMELAAWNFGVVSRLYVGFKEDELRRDYAIPATLRPSAALGFGYPKQKILGRKDRKPLEELVFGEKYGEKLDVKSLP